MRAIWTTLVALLCASVAAQPLSAHPQDATQRRKGQLQSVRLVWQMDLTRQLRTSGYQVQEKIRSSFYKTYLRELRARGVPPAEAETQAKQLSSQVASGELPPCPKFRSEYVIDRIGEHIRVRGSAPAGSPHGCERMTWDILYDGDTAIAVPVEWTVSGKVFSQRADESASHGIGSPWVRVWKASGHVAYHRFHRTPLPLTPENICLLSGLSPQGMYQGAWQSGQEDTREWVLSQRVTEGENAPFVVQLHFSKLHGGAVRQIEWRHERANAFERYTVNKWMQYEGVWLPTQIISERTTPIGIDRYEWRLKQVSKPEKRPLEIANGRPVADYRLLPADTLSSEQLLSKQHLGVAYSWSGSLPTEKELLKIHSQQLSSRSNRTSGGHPYSRLIPPLLLILIGIIWYWRLRRRGEA